MTLRVLALWLTLAAPALAAPQVTGGPVTAFDWSRARCATWDAPDGPARAWRGPGGLRLLISSTASRSSAGPDLDRLLHDCTVAYEGAKADDPGAHDDRVWIAGLHAGAEGRVIALGHAEFHAHRRPGLCAAATYAACWRNSVVELVSGDGGRTFAPAGVVAALPWRHDPAQTRRSGYFNPSNIVARDGWLYAFVFAEATRAQRRGVCLIRRPAAGGFADWRAWDGTGFAARFADAYAEAAADPVADPAATDPARDPAATDPDAHVCAPLPGLSSTLSSVVWNAAAGRWLAVTPATLRDDAGLRRSGVWWTASDDLIRWDRPRLLMDLPLLWRRDCGAEAAWAYPSLIDPDSPSPNFETVGLKAGGSAAGGSAAGGSETGSAAFRLYLVRMPLGPDCHVGPERDLVWFPVSWRRP